MTDPMMDLKSLLEKTPDADLVREMIGFAAERLMEMEVGALADAGYGEKSPERLAQLVRNLVRNAVQAAGAEKVTLTLREVGGAVYLDVEDRGPGVPEGELEHLFRRFYTKRKQGGTGVGLSVAQQIARDLLARHRARVRVGEIGGASGDGGDVCVGWSPPRGGARARAQPSSRTRPGPP